MIEWWQRRRLLRQMRRDLLILWTVAALHRPGGLDVMQVTDLSSRPVFDALGRLEGEGRLVSEEVPDPDGPPRRFYSVTDQGQRHAEDLVRQLSRSRFGNA